MTLPLSRCWASATWSTEFAHAWGEECFGGLASAKVWSALKSERNMSMHAVEVPLIVNMGYSYCQDFLIKGCFTAAVGNPYSYGGVGDSIWGCWGSLLTGNRVWQSCTALGALVSLCYAFPHDGHTSSEVVALTLSITPLLRYEMPSKCTVIFNYKKENFMLRWDT